MRLPSLALALSVAALFSACQSNKIDNSVIVEPDVGVSYAASVQPIFSSGCGGVGCHVGETTNGVNLSNHAQVMSSSGLQYGGSIVVVGDGANSPLVDKIGPSPTHGSRMPLGLAALSASDVALIRTWIDEGATNN
ncbi:MAG: outer membrane scaffolding protein for murein synthesis (MipA/OmpV family) [Rhodothermales bacterium]|jgi:outer membrane scaffolding protein for murein synthesis (MipA/OmpV family)